MKTPTLSQKNHINACTLNRCTIYLLFGLISFVSLLFTSCFSPLNTLIDCPDPAMFFMAGKSWAHGYIPYVDFIDVKGPLLFFIYRIGYILTPGSTLGMYIIHACALSTTLIILYQNAKLFNLSNFCSVLASLVSLYVVFDPILYQKGGQAEMLMLPIIASLNYYFTAFILDTKNEKKKIIQLAVATGSGALCCLYIKYNVTGIYAASSIITITLLIIRKSPLNYIFKFIGISAISFLIFGFPYIVYAIATNSLDDFINIYFILNFETYEIRLADASITKIIARHFFISFKSFFIFVSVFSPFILFQHKKQQLISLSSAAGLTLYILSYFAVTCPCADYYKIILANITIFASVALLTSININEYKRHTKAIVLLCVCFSTAFHNFSTINRMKSIVEPSYPKAFSIIENELEQQNSPTIMYYGWLDRGFGVANVLPAIPIYSTLSGLPEKYKKEQKKAIINKVPDYVFDTYGQVSELLISSGYTKITESDNASFWKKNKANK